MEAKFEEETEAVQRELNNKQCDLVSKIKRAEDNLANMTKQQTDMMEQTRNEVRDVCCRWQPSENYWNIGFLAVLQSSS